MKPGGHAVRYLLLAVALLTAAGCEMCGGPDPEEAVYAVLLERARALRERDLTAYMDLVAPEYGGDPAERERVRRQVKEYFETFERIEYILDEIVIDIRDQTHARAVSDFTLRVEHASGKTAEFSGREQLVLRRRDGHWRIVDGLLGEGRGAEGAP